MEGCSSHFPLLGSDNFGFCSSQSLVMAGHVARTGAKGLEDRLGDRTCANLGLRSGVAVWTKGCGNRLLGDDVTLGHSGDCVVRTRYHDFPLGCIAGFESTARLKYRGRRPGLWSAVSLRSIAASLASTCTRVRRAFRYFFRLAFIRHRTEIVVSGTPS